MTGLTTEPTFGLYLMQDGDAQWCWCVATQPPGEVFHVYIHEERFSTADAAWADGLRRHGDGRGRYADSSQAPPEDAPRGGAFVRLIDRS